MFLNFYYVYALVWGGVLFLYQLGWSELNAPLHPLLLIFFLLSISCSIVLGVKRRKTLHVLNCELPPLHSFLIVSVYIATVACFIQSGSIPALEFLFGSYNYGELLTADGSIFRTVSVVLSILFACYQFERYLDKRKSGDLVSCLSFLLILVLHSSRSPLLICGFVCFLLYVSRKVQSVARINALTFSILALIVGLFVGWLFGVFGNIRSGFEWNDCSLIYEIGFFENHWPEWLPKEFCWAYSYITSPLANLNNSLSLLPKEDAINFIYDFMPMALSKRMPMYVEPCPPLIVPYFNVSTVWSNYVLHLGLPGLFLGFIGQVILLGLVSKAIKKTSFERLGLAFLAECVAFSFFVNSFAYPTMGYPLLIVVAMAVMEKVVLSRKEKSGDDLIESVNKLAASSPKRSHGLDDSAECLFSICVPAHNSVGCIDSLLRSIQGQTCKSWEIILVDDASSDNLIEHMKEQEIIDQARIQLIRLGVNKGPYYARKTAFERATGQYVICVDADDELLSRDALEKLSKVITIYNPDIIQFNGKCGHKDDSCWLDFSESGLKEGINPVDLVREVFVCTALLNNLCFKAIRRQLLTPVDLEGSEGLFMCEDRLECARAIRVMRSFVLYDEPLYYYKHNSDSTTNSLFKEQYCDQQVYVESLIGNYYASELSSEARRTHKRQFLLMWADDMKRMPYKRSLDEVVVCYEHMAKSTFFRNAYREQRCKGQRIDRALLLSLLYNHRLKLAGYLACVLSIVKSHR